MKISAVYIVKNEEKNILQSINSCKNIADEIIVVDTGSTDNTANLCKENNYTVYSYEWENDFSKTRNHAISLCNNEIILFLDADEYFSPNLTIENKNEILEIFKSTNTDSIAFYTEDIDKDTKSIHYSNYSVRIFRNSVNIKYKNSIHEYLSNSQGQLSAEIYPNTKLIHTGYSSNIQKNKIERNIKLLEQIENKTALDYFYLCRENLSIHNYEQSEEYCNKFFQCSDYQHHIDNSNLCYLIYYFRLQLMEHFSDKYSKNDIYKWLKTIKRKLSFVPETYYNMGLWFIKQDIDLAESYFLKAIKINEKFQKTKTNLNNFLNFQPSIYYHLARIETIRNNKEKAIQRATVACMLDPRNEDHLGLLLQMLQRGKTQKNVDYLKHIYAPINKEALEFLVKCLANTDLHEEFITFAVEYNTRHQGDNDNLFYAIMLSGYAEQALNALVKFGSEKSNFIMSVGILLQDDLETYDKYSKFLSEKYQTILEKFKYKKPFNKEEARTAMVMLAKLYVLDVDIKEEKFIELMPLLEEEDIAFLIGIFNNTSEHGKTGKYSKIINIIENYTKIKNIKLNVLLEMYLFSLCKTQKIDKFLQVYEEYYKSNIINKDRSYLYLLNRIKNQQNLEQVEKIINELSYAKI